MQQTVEVEKAMGHKYPEQVVFVTTRSRHGKPNVMAVGWICMVSEQPPMLVMGIDEDAYTFELIKNTKQFVVAYPHEGMAREVLYVGTHHGQDRNKLTEGGLTTQDGIKVKAPLIADAIANFECELVAITKPGDCPLIVGRIVAAHVHTQAATLKRLYNVGKGYKLAGVRALDTP